MILTISILGTLAALWLCLKKRDQHLDGKWRTFANSGQETTDMAAEPCKDTEEQEAAVVPTETVPSEPLEADTGEFRIVVLTITASNGRRITGGTSRTVAIPVHQDGEPTEPIPTQDDVGGSSV